MDLQQFIVDKFRNWQPSEPTVVDRTKNSVTLDWSELQEFQFIEDQLLFRLEKNDKLPPWFVVYSGGKTSKEIYNLPPRYPHKFRLKVIIKASAVPTLAERAIQYYGDEETVYENMKLKNDEDSGEENDEGEFSKKEEKIGNDKHDVKVIKAKKKSRTLEMKSDPPEHKWLESQWSDLTWVSTDTDGSTVVCFCMAVRCGYLKQVNCSPEVQIMLEERPELIGIINSVNGFTPLATAVRKGDINTVRFLLNANADVNQRSSTGQTALHIAVLNANQQIIDLLLEKGADFQAQDTNGLRVEHYAVDSCSVDMVRYILDRGGNVHVTDFNGWTPLFRAICQGTKTAIIDELVVRGSDVNVSDGAGLPLTSIARLLANRHGRPRDSVLRLVDMNYPHEKAVANFTRLTKKIYNVHTLFKLPVKNKQDLRK